MTTQDILDAIHEDALQIVELQESNVARLVAKGR